MNLLVLYLLSQLMVVLLMLVLDLEQLLDQLFQQDLLLPLLMKQLASLLVDMRNRYAAAPASLAYRMVGATDAYNATVTGA